MLTRGRIRWYVDTELFSVTITRTCTYVRVVLYNAFKEMKAFGYFFFFFRLTLYVWVVAGICALRAVYIRGGLTSFGNEYLPQASVT